MHWFLRGLSKYADFSGRARRKEFWMFHLMYLILTALVGFVMGAAGVRNADGFFSLWSLAFFLPSLAVSVRRLHDVGRSGWWVLVPFAGLFFMFVNGDAGPNRFGEDPKAEEQVHQALA